MVIIDMMMNDLNEKSCNIKFDSYIYEKLKELGVDVKYASECSALESDDSNRTIIITENIGGDREYYEENNLINGDKAYYVVSEGCNDRISKIKFSFLKEYIDEDDVINAAFDIVKKVNALDNREEFFDNGNTFVHVVGEDDDIFKIACKHNVTAFAIRKRNGLASNRLRVGQKLVFDKPDCVDDMNDIEDSEDNSTNYIVDTGDSFYSIARKFNMSVSDIKIDNNISTNLLRVGQKLNIRNSSL